MEGNFKDIINFESKQLSYYYAYTTASVGGLISFKNTSYILYGIMHAGWDSNTNTEDLHNGI